jgi:hypothetical protein
MESPAAWLKRSIVWNWMSAEALRCVNSWWFVRVAYFRTSREFFLKYRWAFGGWWRHSIWDIAMISKWFYFPFSRKRHQMVQIVHKPPDQTPGMNFRFTYINFLPSWSFTRKLIISVRISWNFWKNINHSSLNPCNQCEIAYWFVQLCLRSPRW